MNEVSKLTLRPVKEIKGRKRVEAKQRNEDFAWVSATFKIPRPTHKRLRDMAHAQNTSVQQLLEEALDQWLVSQNEPEFYPEGWENVTKRAVLK